MTWRDILNMIEGMNEDDKDTEAHFYDPTDGVISSVEDFILTQEGEYVLLDFESKDFPPSKKE